jgi:glycosyl-4,4'-diaponeurosporenoate acyltransferase
MSLFLRLLLISGAWVVFQIGSGYVTNRMPSRYFARETWLFRPRRWEQQGQVYDRLFRIRRWKDSLPEAGAMFAGGFNKRALGSRTPDRMEQFIGETRRAELTHWLPVLLSFSFFAWNVPSVAIWMPIVGFLGNLPFIMVQRYVRPRLQRLSRKASDRLF